MGPRKIVFNIILIFLAKSKLTFMLLFIHIQPISNCYTCSSKLQDNLDKITLHLTIKHQEALVGRTNKTLVIAWIWIELSCVKILEFRRWHGWWLCQLLQNCNIPLLLRLVFLPFIVYLVFFFLMTANIAGFY